MAKPKLLVIDKSAVIINWVEAALVDDFVVAGVTSAVEAAGAIVREEPALVLIDPDMPVVGESVVALVQKALGSRPAVLVLFSSQPGVELADKTRALGAHAFIEKSGDAHSFAERVRSLTLPPEVWAPAAFTPRPAVEQTPASQPQPAAGDRTILVGGRNWLSRGTLLPRAGFSMVAVADANEVQRSLRSAKPALLILGPDLADATVPEICLAIRADPLIRRVSILFIGEPYEQRRAAEAMEVGANETLLRPLDEMTLFQAVGRLANIATRRKARLLVRIDLEVEQGDEFCVGFTHNVSASGMLLETEQRLEANQPLIVRFFVPGCADEVEAVVDVVRIQAQANGSSVVGVRFEKIAGHHSEAIEEFVHAQGG